MIIDFNKSIKNSSKHGNSAVLIEYNKYGNLRPPIKVPVLIDDESGLHALLHSRRHEWTEIMTEFDTRYLVLFKEGNLPTLGVLILKYENDGDQVSLIDMEQKDIDIISDYVIEEYLKSESDYGNDNWKGKTKPRRFLLDKGELHIELEIADWYPSIWDGLELAGYSWCNANLVLKSYYLDYDRQGEFLERGDIPEIRDAIKALLDRTMEDDKEMRFTEPDLELTFSTEWTDYSEPGRVIYKEGSHTFPPYLKWKVYFWNNSCVLSGHCFEFAFEEEDLKALYVYLRYITQEIDENNPAFRSLVSRGIIK